MALRAAGWTDPGELTILDRADGVGGVWRANTYPGAACDVPSHLYAFAGAPGSQWSRRFAPQPDILRYLQRLTREHGLSENLRLGTEVTEARWDDRRGVWRLSLAGGDALEADVLVPACGQLSRPARPAIAGLDRFPGPVFHSAEWDHGVDLAGKRVAVIGTGASAIQFVPAIADLVAGLTVFQRSAPHVIPKPDRGYGRRLRLPGGRVTGRAFWTAFFETGALGLTSVRTLAVRPEVAARFDAEIQQRLARSVWTGCRSWYRTASGRIVNKWPGTMREYGRRTRRLEATEYELRT
jgi:cation diffusion facilitator CzcD-associated flavoprotein CzcO